jgi:hypothetical protein
VGAEPASETLYDESHGIDSQASGVKARGLLRQVERCELEQAIAVIGDDVLGRGGRELTRQLPQLSVCRPAVGAGCRQIRRPGRPKPRVSRARARAAIAARGLRTGLARPRDLVLTVGCPEAAHGC